MKNDKMDHKEILKPTIGKVLLAIVLVLILPGITYDECGGCPANCSGGYVVQIGVLALNTQLFSDCACNYFYFWPLSIAMSYVISGLVLTHWSKKRSYRSMCQ